MKVLVVDDDQKIAAAVTRGLRAEGFTVDVEHDGIDGLWRAREGSYDVIVLDIMLPGRSGYQICADLREAGDWTPILMLTAKDGELDEAEALDTGADDYLVKPFSYPVLIARLHALIRRSSSRDPAPLQVGALRVDPLARRVWVGDDEVAVTSREFDVLFYLVHRAGQVLSKSNILRGVWSDDFDGDPNIVEVYIARLRRKLTGLDPVLIDTVRGAGYRVGKDWSMRSVRARVTFAATVIVLLVLAGTGAALVAAQSAVLTDNVDEVLVRTGQAIADELDAVTQSGSIPGLGDDDAFGHVIDGSGQVLASTPGPAADFALEDMALVAPDGEGPTFQTVHIAGEPDYRVMIRPIVDGVDIIVGTPLDDVQDSATALIQALLVATPVAGLVLALLVWLLVGRVLRPVERIRQQVAAIGGESLDRRVPMPPGRDEIARLAETMNGMLARLEGSAERQRRFVADASHELRGPLTRMRTELEVDLAHPESADLLATHRSILDDTEGLENLVDDLLTLARSDEGRVPGRRDAVDLDDIVLSEVGRLAVEVRAGVDVSDVSGAQVRGDRAQLARVVRNLLDNAIRHGRPPVRIALHEEAGSAVLRISDEGDGIPEDLREHVFERFGRADEARSPSRGTGLGLAIVRELVIAHGGTIAIDTDRSTGTCFEVRLPLGEAGTLGDHDGAVSGPN